MQKLPEKTACLHAVASLQYLPLSFYCSYQCSEVFVLSCWLNCKLLLGTLLICLRLEFEEQVRCVLLALFQLLGSNPFMIALWLLLPIVLFCIETRLLLETWRLLYLLSFLYSTHEAEIYFMLYFSLTGKMNLKVNHCKMSELLRNSTNLDEGKVLHGFGCLFQVVVFSFPLLSREGSSEKGAKEGK